MKRWYPSIFFYDLKGNKVDWEIYGAEIFISIDGNRKVTVLANEIWNYIKEDEYTDKRDADDEFTRHDEYDNQIWKLKYNTSPSIEELEWREFKAPKVQTLKNYKLSFGINKGLEITENVKVVEAYVHNNNERVTLIYKGLGAFTFELKPATSLAMPNCWNGQF